MSRIKLRVSSGVFEVSLLSVNEERNTVEVIWDEGIKREFKWSSLVWGKTDQAVGQKPTVAAPPHERVYPSIYLQIWITFQLKIIFAEEARSRLNVRFSNNYTSDSTALPAVAHLPPSTTSLHSASGSSYPSSTGQFRYGGTWANSYYPNVSSYGTSTSFSQAPYPYYTYSSSYPPPHPGSRARHDNSAPRSRDPTVGLRRIGLASSAPMSGPRTGTASAASRASRSTRTARVSPRSRTGRWLSPGASCATPRAW